MLRIIAACLLLLCCGYASAANTVIYDFVCDPATVDVYGSTTCTVVVLNDDGFFGPAPTGNVVFSSDSGGAFTPTSCSLATIFWGFSGCAVNYTPTAFGSGTHTLTASYQGNATFNPSNGNYALTVEYPQPTIIAVTPGAGSQGSAVNVTVTGSGFVAGATTLSVSGADVTTSNINVTSSTQLTATFTIGSAAALGFRNVTVTNPTPGGGNATLNNAFEVIPPPPSGPFNAAESGRGISTPLFTKLAGVPFSMDLLAVDTGTGNLETTFSGTVKVELLNATDSSAALDPASRCRASWAVAQLLPNATFAAGDNGRINIAVNYPNALRVARVRVSFPATGTPARVGCSSDAFSIRPQALIASTAMTNSATTGAPSIAAGANFTITADTIPGYDGTPEINNAILIAHAGAVTAGAVNGSFPAANPVTGQSTGTVNYTEAGNFTLPAGGVYDDSFTAIDQPGDCTPNFSNTLDVNGQYGCNFGNISDVGPVGRFTPDHFDVQVFDGCTVDGFTYSRQPFTVTVTARNAAGVTTQNYDGSFAKDVTLSNAGDVSDLTNNMISAIDFSAGTVTINDLIYEFPDAETVATDIAIRAVDEDGASSAGHLEETTNLRSGRFVIASASTIAINNPFFDGQMPVSVQTWQQVSPGIFDWATHTDDTSCTTPVIGNFSLVPGSYTGNLQAGETSISNFAYNNGAGTLTLPNPGNGNDGTVDVTGTVDAWLQFNWNGSGYEDPKGTMRFFDIFATEQRFIERHEIVP
ncbi:MAG TPA: DUF6701 domain-containing protein [Gammaproteobacteria bacterium]